MPTSTHDETSTAADLGRGAGAPLPREGSQERTTDTPARDRRSNAVSIIGLLLIAALAGGLFTYSANRSSTETTDSPTEALRRWLDDHPDDPVAWRQLGDLHLADATAADDIAAYLAAADALERSEALDPSTIETTRSLAVAAVGLHRFRDAADRSALVLAQRPDDRVALAALVDAEIELGRYDNAAATADRLGRLRPDAVSLSRLSYVSQLAGDHDRAIDQMYAARTAAQGSPAQVARLSIFLGDLHRLAGDREAASQLYQDASAEPSMFARANVALAQLAAGDGNVAEARRLLDVQGVTGSGLAALQAAARVHGAAGDDAGLERAIEQVRGVVDGSIAADVGVEPSEVLLEADFGDAKRAQVLGELVIEAQPDGIFAHHAVAWAAYVNNDLTAAADHIDLALRTGVRDPLVLAHAALIQQASGNQIAASTLYQLALEIDPGVVRPYDGLTSDMFATIDISAEEATS